MNNIIKCVKSVYENNKRQTVILVAAVVMLLFLSFFNSETVKKDQSSDNIKSVYSLENELERKLEDFLQTVEGVGNVKVCVTFDILEQISYAQNVDDEQKADTKKQKSEYVIIENKEGKEDGLALTVQAPKIRGVAVSCAGGASAKVRNEVTALLSSALGISSNRVCVSQYKTK